MIELIIARLEGFVQSLDEDSFKAEFEKNENEIRSYRSASGITLAHIASYWGSVPILRFLKEKGMDLDAPNDEGEPPLFMAVDGGVQEVIRYLLDLGVNPNHRGYLGRSAFFILAGSMVATNKHEIFEILLANGTSVDHVDDLGIPFAIFLVNENRPKLLQAVIPHVKDINVKDAKGRTALDYAGFYDCKKGMQQRDLLLSAGAQPGTGFAEDERPFDWAMYGEDPA